MLVKMVPNATINSHLKGEGYTSNPICTSRDTTKTSHVVCHITLGALVT